MRNFYVLGLLLLCTTTHTLGQTYRFAKKKKFERIKFEQVNNLILVPVTINGAPLKFILDSGVSSPILFNLNDQDSIQINNVSSITLRGLGEGEPIEALRSVHNTVKFGKAVNHDQSLFVVMDKDLNLSPSLGTPVHGIIGYDIFKDFVVEVNYAASVLKLYRPNTYPYYKKKYKTIPLAIEAKKAYVKGSVVRNDDKEIPVKLLVDTGSSDALWLFKDSIRGLDVPKKNFEEFLGKGLSGSIYGKRSKIKGIRMGDYFLSETKTAFPYKTSFLALNNLKDRNGSLGGEVLKRFNLVFDYHNEKLSLVKNGNFNMPYQYNLSGLSIQHNGVRYISERIADARGIVDAEHNDSFGNVQIVMENRTKLSLVPEIVVSGIRAGSPAERAGLQEGDVILMVNNKRVHRYKLQEVLQMLNNKKGKRVKMVIERYNRDQHFSFVLKDVFENKKP
ncbi:PDZ domain-containing protein [Flavobacterium sp. ASW18X]|uniref:PDZ domain-containing protein n=1 Tax=Flavobacterium sp. ASW18X TaxID=2572595 RepID=UPI0010AEDEDA|nr:PDZ domain-containing protein [Flavobacterium sp. ASW18X]TKD56558.1 PDZ domain-containing protein [Flavobacterium sp. ASW18X]